MCRTSQGPSVRDGKPGTGKLGTVCYYLGNRGQKTGDSILFLPLGPGFVDPGFGGRRPPPPLENSLLSPAPGGRRDVADERAVRVKGEPPRPAPESCVWHPRGGRRSVERGHLRAGVLSRERFRIQGADPVGQWGRQHGRARAGECLHRPLRGRRPHARMETPRAQTGRSLDRPPSGWTSPHREGPKPMMHGRENSGPGTHALS